MPLSALDCTIDFCANGLSLPLSKDEISELSKSQQKHLRDYHGEEIDYTDDENNQFQCHRNANYDFICLCGNIYRPRSSMIRHIQEKECRQLEELIESATAYESLELTFLPRVKKSRRNDVEGADLLVPILESLQTIAGEIREMRREQACKDEQQESLWRQLLENQKDYESLKKENQGN